MCVAWLIGGVVHRSTWFMTSYGYRLYYMTYSIILTQALDYNSTAPNAVHGWQAQHFLLPIPSRSRLDHRYPHQCNAMGRDPASTCTPGAQFQILTQCWHSVASNEQNSLGYLGYDQEDQPLTNFYVSLHACLLITYWNHIPLQDGPKMMTFPGIILL